MDNLVIMKSMDLEHMNGILIFKNLSNFFEILIKKKGEMEENILEIGIFISINLLSLND